MTNDSITFNCPACSIKLTVPASLAGVTGPCPTCRAIIQAPYGSPVQVAPLSTLAHHAPEVVVSSPLKQTLEALPGSLPIASLPAYLTHPLNQAAAVAEREPNPAPPPAALRPEPRQLPNRSDSSELVAKPMPEPNRDGQSSKAHVSRGHHSSAKSRVLRILLPILFCLVAAGLVFGVLSLLNSKTGPIAPEKLPVAPAPKPILHNDVRSPSPTKSSQNRVPSLPMPTPEQPTLGEPLPTPTPGIETVTPGMAAMAVLEKFLTAKTLAERLPYIETQTPEAELAKSCLASPLPMTSKIEIDAQETNAVEQVIDFYHNVDFVVEGQPVNPQTILVRSRGTGDPKVVVDPFLDSFGGRLAAYAKTMSDKAGLFQVTVSAIASCNEEHVPNREKKLTLKLLSRDNTKEITRAYFARQSKIAEMLENGTYSLSYGKAKACTVMLRWNTEDNPSMPYLEALTLKTLDWNP